MSKIIILGLCLLASAVLLEAQYQRGGQVGWGRGGAGARGTQRGRFHHDSSDESSSEEEQDHPLADLVSGFLAQGGRQGNAQRGGAGTRGRLGQQEGAARRGVNGRVVTEDSSSEEDSSSSEEHVRTSQRGRSGGVAGGLGQNRQALLRNVGGRLGQYVQGLLQESGRQGSGRRGGY